MFDEPRRYIQLVTLIISLSGLVIGIIMAGKCRRVQYCYYALASLFWLAHVSLFYTVLFITNSTPAIDFTAWSVSVRIHGVITAITTVMVLLRRG